MVPYIFHFLLNMAVGFVLLRPVREGVTEEGEPLSEEERNRRKILYLVFSVVQLGLFCGFRAISVGHDTVGYAQIFADAPRTWREAFTSQTHIEIGFRLLCTSIKMLGGNHQTLLVICSLFTMGSSAVFLYRHSKDLQLSMFVLISFPFYYTSFDIVRHYLATAFFLLAYKYLVERKLPQYVLFLLVGSLFHSVALLFIPLYFLPYLRWNPITIAITAAGTLLLFLYVEPIGAWISQILGRSYTDFSIWLGTYSGGVRTAIMYGVVLALSILAYAQLRDRGPDDMMALHHVVLLLIFSVLFITARMMIRMMVSTVPLMAIAMPQLLDRERFDSERDHSILKAVLIGVGCLYHAFMLFINWQNILPYVPFWR